MSAFKQIYNRYAHHVYKTAYNFLGSAERSEDLMHEIFLVVWVNRANFIRVENMGAYLVTMSKNLALKHFRKLKKQKDAEKEYSNGVERAENFTELRLNGKELEETLRKAIDSLPPQQKQVFQLVKMEGLSHKAVSHQLQISPITVKRHVMLASRSIRAYLEPLGMPIPVSLLCFLFFTQDPFLSVLLTSDTCSFL